MEPLSELQQAEELIKQEMITMLHHDCLHHPSANAASQLLRGKTRGPTSASNNASHIAYLETHPYNKTVSPEEDMGQVEQAATELQTFKQLKKQEDLAILRRQEALREDVERQMEREKELQQRYGELLMEREALLNSAQKY